MKRIVVYQSSTGFTKQYAEWIAQDLQCQAKPLSEVSKKELADQEMVIFGGWVMGNMIMGLDKIKREYDGYLAIFAVGASTLSGQVIQELEANNRIDDQPFFYMQGGLKLQELNFVKRKMLNVVKKSLSKKQDKTSKDKDMEKALSASFSALNRKNIKLLVDYLL